MLESVHTILPKLRGDRVLDGAGVKLGQDRYFECFPTNANQITLGDGLRRCLLARRIPGRTPFFMDISLFSDIKSDFVSCK